MGPRRSGSWGAKSDRPLRHTTQPATPTAAMAASASSVLLFVVSFLWALFLPLSYHALKCARDRFLDGWIVSCLIVIVVQVILFGIALSLGYIIGPVYLVYCLVRMAILKKRAKKAALR